MVGCKEAIVVEFVAMDVAGNAEVVAVDVGVLVSLVATVPVVSDVVAVGTFNTDDFIAVGAKDSMEVGAKAKFVASIVIERFVVDKGDLGGSAVEEKGESVVDKYFEGDAPENDGVVGAETLFMTG